MTREQEVNGALSVKLVEKQCLFVSSLCLGPQEELQTWRLSSII